jgi:hypothetical protein
MSDRTVWRRSLRFMSSTLINQLRHVRRVGAWRKLASLLPCCAEATLRPWPNHKVTRNGLKKELRPGSTSESMLGKLLARCGRWLEQCLASHSWIRALFFAPALNSPPQGMTAGRLACTSPAADNESSYPCNTELANRSSCRSGAGSQRTKGLHCNVHDLNKTNR